MHPTRTLDAETRPACIMPTGRDMGTTMRMHEQYANTIAQQRVRFTMTADCANQTHRYNN
eukprot:7277259-Lingulodinium_polyedra.AAC.1